MGDIFVTIDDDLENQIRDKVKRKGDLSKIVNATLRKGLNFEELLNQQEVIDIEQNGKTFHFFDKDELENVLRGNSHNDNIKRAGTNKTNQ